MRRTRSRLPAGTCGIFRLVCACLCKRSEVIWKSKVIQDLQWCHGCGFQEMGSLSICLVVYLPLWKIWKSVGVIVPNVWKNKKCSKPPTSHFPYMEDHECVKTMVNHPPFLANCPPCGSAKRAHMPQIDPWQREREQLCSCGLKPCFLGGSVAGVWSENMDPSQKSHGWYWWIVGESLARYCWMISWNVLDDAAETQINKYLFSSYGFWWFLTLWAENHEQRVEDGSSWSTNTQVSGWSEHV